MALLEIARHPDDREPLLREALTSARQVLDPRGRAGLLFEIARAFPE